ncbi:MAG: CoA transferase [Dehalococcoidia bacterium]|nr:CoA transferase [Dehalococcoidia bacterium]
MTEGMLHGVRVLELGEGVSAPYCGKTLANLGAEVIKIESPEGDISRTMGPFPGDITHQEKSGVFLALNANKYGVTLDVETEEGAEAFRHLARTADIIVESMPVGWLDERRLGYSALADGHPALTMTSLSPFGTWGTYAGYKLTDLTLFHMSGQAHSLLGPVSDPDSQPPIRAGGHQAELVAGMSAATATLMALFRTRITGKGCHIEASAYEAMATQLVSALASCAFDRPPPSRALSEVQEAATGGVVSAVGGILPCSDGYVAISPREDAQWQRWVELMGNPRWASEDRFLTRDGRESNFTELWDLVGEWTKHRSKHDIARMGQERRIPCFPVNTVHDLFNDPHLKEREFFTTIEHPIAGELQYPGVPYRFSNTPLPLAERPAPMLGQHNDIYLREDSRL